MSREKQIEEMDKDIGEAIMHNSVVDIINGGFIGVNSEGMARELYDEGYRKQREGEWNTECIASTSGGFNWYSHGCSNCSYYYKTTVPIGYDYCSHCGAKMNGCAE